MSIMATFLGVRRIVNVELGMVMVGFLFSVDNLK
jgi:hypothetical protein